MTTSNNAHTAEYHAARFAPQTWRNPSEDRRYCTCSYCGSINPTDLAAAIKGGATLDPADRKYGWPHKFYASGPVATHAKFYTKHLVDATQDERLVIERAMGMYMVFEPDAVRWFPFVEPVKA